MARLWYELPPDDSVLLRHRARVLYFLAYIVTLFVTPFAINDFLQGRTTLSLSTMAVVAAFIVNGVAIHLKKRPPIPFFVLFIPVGASITLALFKQPLYGAMWCYPTVLFCFFALARTPAVATSLVLLAGATSAVFAGVGMDIALRYATTLSMTIMISYIISSVIAELQRELLDQASIDPLTGAFNRRQIETFLAEAVERRSRSSAPASVLLVDLDHFKSVNDRFGHGVGDEVLKALVALMKKQARKLDRVFRMGGEEFLLLLSDTRGQDALRQAERLRALVAETALTDKATVTVSIGVAECVPNQAIDHWIKLADDALYRAKHEGRNRVIAATAAPAAAPAVSSEAEREAAAAERRTRERSAVE